MGEYSKLKNMQREGVNMTVEWPKKKECPYHDIKTSKVNCGTCKEARVHNACHDAFMKVIESKELHPDTTDWNKGGKLALEFLNKSQPQLIPLDDAKVEMIRNLVNWPKHDLKFGMKSHKLTVGEERDLIRYFNSIFVQSKEKLIPLDRGNIGAFLRNLFVYDAANGYEYQTESLDGLIEAIYNKFGIPPHNESVVQPEEVTVADIQKVVNDYNNFLIPSGKSLAQAIHERIKRGK